MAVMSEPDNSPLPGTVFTPRQVRALKIAVIVMGVLLVGGFAFVLAAIVYQASHLGKSAQRQTASPASVSRDVPPGVDLAIPRDATVTSMDLDGERLALHLNSSLGPEVVIVDVGSGKVLARIKIKPQ